MINLIDLKERLPRPAFLVYARRAGLAMTILLGLFFYQRVGTYEISTHVNLTSAIFDFYNKNFPDKKIPEEFRAMLVEGSRREDDAPRWLNHFYDPIYNRGLTLSSVSWEKSKDWAQDNKSQLALAYARPSLAQLFGLSEDPLVFTWQKAIKTYNKGDQKNAFLILGHVLHLLEDADVPDHTRNDQHLEGSPYELFTKDLIPEIDAKKKPVVLENLGKYFDQLAKYSNENFYSKDTINDKEYKNPQPAYATEDGNNLYQFKADEHGNFYHLLLVKPENSLLEKNTIIDNKIFTDYWSHLAPKAIQYGAGLIDLFFREAEKQKKEEIASLSARNDGKIASPDGGRSRNDKNGTNKTFAGQLLGAFKDLFSSASGSGFEEVAVVDLKSQEILPRQLASQNDNTKEILPRQLAGQNDGAKEIASSAPLSGDRNDGTTGIASGAPQSGAPRNDNLVCSWLNGDSQQAGRQNLILNEINWVGSANDANDEWLELKNISLAEINISGWQLLSKSGNIKIKFGPSAGSGQAGDPSFAPLNGSYGGQGKISAGGFVLLTRGKDYKGALRNTDDGLRLYDNQCHLLDEVLANPNWPAGDNTKKLSAERGQDFSWHNGVPNSPGRENSTGINIVGGGASAPDQNSPTQNTPATSTSSTTNNTNTVGDSGHLLLSEILFDAEGSDDGKEFIELYNPTDKVIYFTDWAIQHQSASGSLSKKNFEKGQQIQPRGFFLIWLGTDTRADLQWLSGSLNNTGATISLLNGTTTIDFVTYNKNQQPFPTAPGQSLERKAYSNGQCVSASGGGELLGNGCNTDSLNDWEIRPTPNPQNSKSSVEPPTSQQANASSTSISTNSSSSLAELDFQPTINFYKDSRPSAANLQNSPPTDSTTNYLIEFSADKYPFVADKFNYGESWKGMVFYLNREPEEIVSVIDFVNTATTFKNALPIKYEICSGNNPVQSNWLLLPDSAARCGILGGGEGGAYSYSFDYKNIEDKNFLLTVPGNAITSTLSASDYLTVAYYGTEAINPQDGRYPYFRLVATSTKKFYFKEQAPTHQSPRLTGSVNLNFDRQNSRLLIDWPRASDADTLDRLLTYEIRYHDTDSWLDLGEATSAVKFVAPDDDLSISVRAKDDFGNYSEPINARWSYPKTEFSIAVLSAATSSENWSRSFGRGEDICLNSDGSNCLSAVSVQGFRSEATSSFNTIVLRLKQNLVSDHSTIRLGIYADDGGQPNMNQKISETAITDLYNPDPNQELAFYFNQPVALTAGATYWLVLNADYLDSRGPWRNSWSNAIYGVNDTYLNGVAGYGDIAFCRPDGGLLNRCRFSFNDPTADWYMKIGLAE